MKGIRVVDVAVLVGVLLHSSHIQAGSHSLWAFATFILGDTQFPQYTAVLMLDDLQVGYFHSDETGHIIPHVTTLHQKDLVIIFQHVYKSLKHRVYFLKDHFNCTQGINVQQRRVGCELWDDGTPDQMTSSDAFNGERGEGGNINDKSYTLESKWHNKWSKTKEIVMKSLYRNFYLPVCIKTLKDFLMSKRLTLMRRVKPRVWLLQKTLLDSKGAKVTCLATGFYPRHINLTLLRDGQPVSDHQITGGDLLPNGDETYQMRKSLEVRAEELQHHQYTCTAEHLSLDNRLDIDFERDWNSETPPIVSSVAELVSLFGAICVIIVWRRRRRTGQSSQSSLQSHYSPTPNTDEIEENEDLEL